MNINDMLSDDAFLMNFDGTSKKQVLEELSKLAEVKLGINSRTLLENLTKRENLLAHMNLSAFSQPQPIISASPKSPYYLRNLSVCFHLVAHTKTRIRTKQSFISLKPYLGMNCFNLAIKICFLW